MTKVLESSALDPEKREQWNARLSDKDDLVTSAGATCRFEVVRLIDQVLAPREAERVIWHIAHDESDSFFPCVIIPKSTGPAVWSELRPITDLYPGRSAPAVKFRDDDTANDLLNAAFLNWRRWDSLITNVLADSAFEQKLLDVAIANGFKPVIRSETECPYIQLPNSWHKLYDSFGKKFRYNIRNSEKLLRERGAIELRRFTDTTSVDEFLEDFLSVERLSWKQEAGTSITRNPEQLKFHTELAPVAAAADIFRGYVLYLDETPIAHIFGLYDQGTFYCLKLSYVEALKKFAPGITITAMAIKDLVDNSAKLWDFVGPTEGYKRRWAKESYVVRKYVFFSRTLRGRLLNIRRRLRSVFRQRASKQR